MNTKSRAGSEAQYGPRLAGEVLHDYLENSNEPLAVALRNWKAKGEAAGAEDVDGRLFKDLFPDTHLCVDLKMITRQKGRMPVGRYLDGVITRVGEDQFTFVQNDACRKIPAATRRNPHVYLGRRINVNRKDDGTLYPTFNRPPYTDDFSFQVFCREAAGELLAVAGLIEK